MTSFTEHACRLLQDKARAILLDLEDEEAQIGFAAHAYVLAIALINRHGASSLGLTRLANDRSSLEAMARSWLDEQPLSLSPERFYARLIDSLKAIEGLLGQDNAVHGYDPPSVALDRGGACGLTGNVVHRFVVGNALRELRRLEPRQRALPAIQNRPAHPAEQLEHLRLHWNASAKEPTIHFPGPFPDSPLVWNAGEALSKGDGFRLLLCPVPVPAVPQFELMDGCRRFRAKGPSSVTELEMLHDHVDRVLEAAREHEVHLVVFPELMVCQATQEHLASRLKGLPRFDFPFAVVAGSFHRWDGPRDAPSTRMFNESVILDRQGLLLTHQKRGKFSFKPAELPQNPSDDPMFPGRLPIPADVEEVVEAFDHDGRLELLETSLGRIAVAICTDCIAPNPTTLESVYREVHPDLLVIVSMTSETDKFETFMTNIAEHGVSAVMVNSHLVAEKKKSAFLAAVSLGFGEPSGSPPIRYRWLAGDRDAQIRYLKPVDDNKAWRPASSSGQDMGARLLHLQDEALGLLVDLQIHQKWNKEWKKKAEEADKEQVENS